jgi:glycosyltransferase involved in cell wall biosynthesis
MLNILFDMSGFGYAHCYERAKTGIFRFGEQIAKGLLASGEATLIGYASQGNDDDCLAFLAGHPQLGACQSAFVRGMAGCERVELESRGFLGRVNRLLRRRGAADSKTVCLPNIQICHAMSYPLPLPVIRHGRIATVQTVHDLIPILFPQFFEFDESAVLRTVMERLTPRTCVICNSESTRNDLCTAVPRLDPARVFVTRLAAADIFQPCSDGERLPAVRFRYGIPADSRYLLSVCTLEPRKNIELVIRSFVRLVSEHNLPDLRLVLTGTKGWKFDGIFAQLAHANPVRERIILTGYVPDEDLAPLYSGALAFVYPSLYEGFGLPPLEAMQCGTPVITANTSSLPEVVGDGGIMIDPHDGDGLCQAMLDLYQDGELRTALAHKALTRAAGFSWQKCVTETLAVYRQAAAACRGAGEPARRNNGKKSADLRHFRTGRRIPGPAAPGQGVRGLRYGPGCPDLFIRQPEAVGNQGEHPVGVHGGERFPQRAPDPGESGAG